MKRVRRNALRVTLAVTGLIATLCLVCLDRVDSRPYAGESYYSDTMSRLRQITETNRICRGGFHAGFGRARLTPEINAGPGEEGLGKFRQMPLAGYGDRNGRPAIGVHDDLLVKAVALKAGGELAIVFGADALIVPREVADLTAAELREKFKLRREQLYFSATHTHCGIGGWGEGLIGEVFAGEFDPKARAWFADRLVTAAREALADLQPAKYGHGSFLAKDHVHNRLVGQSGEVDAEFSYAVVHQESGRAAVLGCYGAHATVLPGSVMEFSGDYPGYWQREIERATGGMALFMAGCVGSHGPVPGAAGFEGARQMGEALARRTLEELPRAVTTNVIELGVIAVEFSLPPLNIRVTDDVRLRPWLGAALLRPEERSYAQGLRLDRSLWLATPCDFSGELSLDIKREFRREGFSLSITSFNGDYIGYVIPARYYGVNGYEPRLMSFFGPHVADYLTELMRVLARDLIVTNGHFSSNI